MNTAKYYHYGSIQLNNAPTDQYLKVQNRI